MKGLFLKDYYLFIKRCRRIIVLILLAVIFPLIVPNVQLFVFYPVLFISMIPMTLVAYDAGDKWNQYAAAMPYSKKDMVVEKYLFGLIVSFITIALTVSAGIAADAIKNCLDIGHYAGLTVMLLSLGLISPALMLPFVFKYGVEKGRICYYVLVGIVCSAVIGLSSYGNELEAFNFFGVLPGYAAIGAAAIIYVCSICLSVRFAAKSREY